MLVINNLFYFKYKLTSHQFILFFDKQYVDVERLAL